MPPIPQAHVRHGMARRLRINVPSRRKDSDYFHALEERLIKCPGVESVLVNPQTGSVLLVHDSDIGTIAKFASKEGLFHLRPSSRPRKSLLARVGDTFQGYNKQLKGMTGGEFDIPSLVFLSLVISGIFQIMKGNVGAPAWYTAFYYALGIFTKTAADEFDEGDSLEELGEDIADLGESD